jgi:hypothetical protein
MKVQTSTLTISNVTDNSFGIYKCFVKANIGNYFDSINLQASSKSPGKVNEHLVNFLTM